MPLLSTATGDSTKNKKIKIKKSPDTGDNASQEYVYHSTTLSLSPKTITTAWEGGGGDRKPGGEGWTRSISRWTPWSGDQQHKWIASHQKLLRPF